MGAGEILSLAVAALIGLYTLTLQPWSAQWWVSVAIASVIGTGAIIHLIWNKVPETARVAIRPLIWKPTGYLRSWVGILLILAIFGAGYTGSHWHYSPPKPPIEAPAEHPQPSIMPPGMAILSRFGTYIFDCAIPPPKSASDYPQQKEIARQSIEAWGDAVGFTMTLTDIRGGIRIAAEATTDDAVNKLGVVGIMGVRKFSLEIRRVGKDEIVNLALELPPTSPFSFFKLLPPDPNAEDSIKGRQQIERILGVSEGTCRMI